MHVTERQRGKEFITSSRLSQKGKKKGYDSILERFQICPIFRESQLAIGWDEAFCAHYDKISKENHTYVCTAEEHERREQLGVLVLNSQGKNGPMRQREDYAEAIRIKERLHEESGEGRTKNGSQDSVKELNELTRKLDGDGILLLPHQARLRRGGNHLKNGGRHRVGTNSDFFF